MAEMVNPWGGFYQGQQNLMNAMDKRYERAQTERQNALYDRQAGQSEQANEIKLIGIQAETIGKALDSVKDEQSHQAYRGFLQQLSQTPMGQNKFFQMVMQGTPERFDPQAIEQGRMKLNALRQQVGEKTGQRIQTVDLGDKVEYIFPDGRREMKPKGVAPRAEGDRSAPDPYYTPIMTSTGIVSFNNRGGTVSPVTVDGKTPLLPIAADVGLAGDKTAAQESAKNTEKKRAVLPKMRNTMATLNSQWDMLDDKIDEAINAVSPFTAGAGAWVASIPATPQRNLRETLLTIKSNMGFDKLQEMRENSPTGGALGQVSDTENLLLQAVQGSLDQGQSPAQLQKNLKVIKKNLARLRAQKELAFETDFGEFDGKQGNNRPSAVGSAAPVAGDIRPSTAGSYLQKFED